MSDLRTAAQQALEALEWHLERGAWGADIEGVTVALRAALAQQEAPVELEQVDLSRCPQCGGIADNGHDRSIPPNPYFCSKCMAEPVVDQTLDEAMRLPRAMAQAYENGYKAGVAARDAEHQQTLALQQRSYEREIQLDVEAERERCLRLIDEHVRAVDAEDLVRAIKEGKE